MRQPDETDPGSYSPGDYGRLAERWYYLTPSGHLGDLGQNPDGQEGRPLVTEHPNGTISVEPAIHVRGVDGLENEVTLYHGTLIEGAWGDVSP